MKMSSHIKKINIHFYYILIFLFSFLFSCVDDNVEKNPSRLFRPISFSASVSGSTVEFSWVPIKNATYLLEISRDSLLFDQDIQVFSVESVNKYIVEDLWGNSRYSARIKAVSLNPEVKDSEYQIITFITQTENIFYTLADEDIERNQVTVKWKEGKVVNRILILTNGSDDSAISLSEDDISSSKRIITGLLPGTNYTFRIYLDERLRGSISTKTKL